MICGCFAEAGAPTPARTGCGKDYDPQRQNGVCPDHEEFDASPGPPGQRAGLGSVDGGSP